MVDNEWNSSITQELRQFLTGRRFEKDPSRKVQETPPVGPHWVGDLEWWRVFHERAARPRASLPAERGAPAAFLHWKELAAMHLPMRALEKRSRRAFHHAAAPGRAGAFHSLW